MNIPIKVDPQGAEQKIGGVEKSLAKLEDEAAKAQQACNSLSGTFKRIADHERAMAAETARVKSAMDGLGGSFARIGQMQLGQTLAATGKAFAGLTAQIAHEQKVLESIHGPMKQYQQDLQTLDVLLKRGSISATEHAAAVARSRSSAGVANPMDAVSLGAAPRSGMDIAGMIPGPGAAAAGAGAMVAGAIKEQVDNFVEHRRATEEATNSILKFHDSFETASSAMVEQTQLASDLHIEIRRTAAAYGAVREASADMYLTSAQQVDITRNLTAAIVADGGAIEDVSGVMQKFQLAMEAGGMSSRELKGILMQSDDVMGMMEVSTGKTYKELMALAKAGKLNTEILEQAVRGFANQDSAMKKYSERAMDLGKTMDELHLSIGEAALVIAEAKEAYEAAAPSMAEPFLQGIAAAQRFIDLTAKASGSMATLQAISALAAGGKVVGDANKQIEDFNLMLDLSGASSVKKYHDRIDALNRVIKDHPDQADMARRAITALNNEHVNGAKAVKDHADAYKAYRDILNGAGGPGRGPKSTSPTFSTSMGGQAYDAYVRQQVEMLSAQAGEPDLEADLKAHRNGKNPFEAGGGGGVGMQQSDLLTMKWKKDLDDLRDRSISVRENLSEGFGSLAGDIADMAASGKASFAEMTSSMASMMLQLLATQAFTQLGKIIGGDSIGGGSSTPAVPAFATGGMIMPGGTGGTDSQLVMFRKSPDEMVRIHTPQQEQRFTERATPQGARPGGSQAINFHVNSVARQMESEDGRRTIVRVMTDAFPHLRTRSGRG